MDDIKYYDACSSRGNMNTYAVFNGNKYYKVKGGYFKQSKFPHTFLHHDVWEYHGNKLLPGYDLHHKDENKRNNNIENLEMLTTKEHSRLHMLEKEKVIKCKLCGKEFVSAGSIPNACYCPACRKIHSKSYKANWAKQNRKHLNELSLKNYHEKKYFEERVCKICGKKFYAYKGGPQFVCSRTCANKIGQIKKRNAKKINNPFKKTVICPVCGKSFETYVNSHNAKKTCSIKCSYIYRSQLWKNKSSAS